MEADIVDTKGNLDVTDKHLMNMDILVAGFHRFIRSTSVKDYFSYVLFNGFITDVFGTTAKKKRRRPTRLSRQSKTIPSIFCRTSAIMRSST